MFVRSENSQTAKREKCASACVGIKPLKTGN